MRSNIFCQTSRLSALEERLQRAISSKVLKHPKQSFDCASISQTAMQGETTKSESAPASKTKADLSKSL
jgi:hypothetical protein